MTTKSDPSLEPLDAATLLDLRKDPPRMGRLAAQRRAALFGSRVLLRPSPDNRPAAGVQAAVLRRGELVVLGDWPDPDAWQPGDRMLLALEPEDEAGARRYVDWLLALARTPTLAERLTIGDLCGLAPYSRRAGGTHRLWLIAAARLALPPAIRVEARHDLIGIRLAQVALGFGADTLSGPLGDERKLPVAGVTRPTEASITGLRNLVEQAGLECALYEEGSPRRLDAMNHTRPMQVASSEDPQP
ncbi:hypothetical protein G6O69_28440 [Pseudenhygromyxa sp. WMMC2535]|uniref:hypothetical protein n=1 Tax=Pseudenhygromyxa sp. WMMC2535 TaxID=2712867 RepID=UPI0015544B7D|nr:hypothetical protein [Pseudenhygromyxa sp. WMMC2535]NVB41795.1 hypothetical protein [Pseudenhygromyxa sp. WMMC2535]